MGAIGNLIPLVILFTVVGFTAYIGYQIYLWTNELADRGVKKMEKKNVVFTKDGMKVGVKEVKQEDYADKTQSVLVKAWNFASFPAYKSRLGWNSTAGDSPSSHPAPQRSASSSSRTTPSRSSSTLSNSAKRRV